MRVVVPFGGRDPKTRLAPFFDADERREFAVSMLRDVLDAVRAVGGDPAVVLSSLVFASIHLWSFSGEGLYVSLGMVLVLGSVLAVVYERSGNLLVVALVHGLYNAVQFLVSYAQATGLV